MKEIPAQLALGPAIQCAAGTLGITSRAWKHAQSLALAQTR